MGSRGEGWVVVQFVAGAAILVATAFARLDLGVAGQIAGIAFLVVGGVLGLLGIIGLGRNLTPFPKPLEGAHLVTRGVYGVVRHPIYAGIAFGALGWSLWWGALISVALSLALFVVFDLKSRREEKWLVEKYPQYPEYQTRVKKLIPFIY